MPGRVSPEAAGKAVRWGLAAAAAWLLLFVMPAPYVLYEPGKVVPVGELVAVGGTETGEYAGSGGDAAAGEDEDNGEVAGIGEDEGNGKVARIGEVAGNGEAASAGEWNWSRASGRQGEWLLTTVYLEPRATLWSVIAAAWRIDREAHTKRAVFGGSGAKSYKARMDVLMAESQAGAVEAAYRLAGLRYETVPDGVYVVRGAGRLEAGDRIMAVDGVEVNGLEELFGALRKRSGDEAELTVLRAGSEIAVRIAVDLAGAERPEAVRAETDSRAADRAGAADRADTDAPPYSLAGAELTEIPAIRPKDPAPSVTIDAGGFAGPSAGLPIALHICEQLTGESLTGGRRVAATGTIAPTGAVGAVGGVRMKAIAAARAGADLFLVPEANAAEAADAAKAAGGAMEVAGVGSLEEAVALLRSRIGQEGRTMTGGS